MSNLQRSTWEDTHRRADCGEMSVGRITGIMSDSNGRQQYFPEVSAIVFLVDSKDHERFAESRAELDALLAMEPLAKTPFLILGNKIDRMWIG